MVKGIEKEKIHEPTIFKDSIIAGMLHAFGHEVKPIKNLDGQINYEVFGDASKTVEDIYSNCSIGALDVLRSIKLTRSMIFNLR